MGSRERILQTIKQNKPPVLPLPSLPAFSRVTYSPLNTFVETVTAIGGHVVVNNLEQLKEFLAQQKQKGVQTINGVAELSGYNIADYKDYKAIDLERVNTVVIKGKIAVAENGSIWVTDSSIGNRVLPFICEHLIIVINEASIVPTMHQAYEKIKIDEEGYGVFIAGPSKTADIEQSLVVGAHGPLSLQVYIV
jgi:L-lactate dehydrogenase complex protein LldG